MAVSRDQNVVPNGEWFSFQGKGLHANLVSSNYSRKRRIAVHEYLKRDGGQTEDMGREPFRVSINLIFVGEDVRAQVIKVAQVFDTNPHGLFVDPLFGEFQATCEGFDRAAIDYDRASNMITVPLTFVENNIDAKLADVEFRSANESSQSLTDMIAEMVEDASVYTGALVVSAVNSFVNAATEYNEAAINSFLETSIDLSLSTRLGSIAGLTAAAQAALITAAGSEVLAYDAIAASERVAAACVQLQQSILDSRPPMGRYTVPTLTHVVALAQFFYGNAGLARIPEILSNNPDITDPSAIEAGQVMLMAQPTV